MGELKDRERITVIVKRGYKTELQEIADMKGKALSVFGGEIIENQIDAWKANQKASNGGV